MFNISNIKQIITATENTFVGSLNKIKAYLYVDISIFELSPPNLTKKEALQVADSALEYIFDTIYSKKKTN